MHVAWSVTQGCPFVVHVSVSSNLLILLLLVLAATEQLKVKSVVVAEPPAGYRVTLTVASASDSAPNVKVVGSSVIEQSSPKS